MEEASPSKPGGLKICFPSFGLTLMIEMRTFVLAFMIVPLYAISALVGNEWGYMLPSAMVAAMVIGFTLPLIEVMSLAASCVVPSNNAALSEQEILLKAWRLPFWGLLSKVVPSGYLSAKLHLTRRGWKGAKKIPAVLPLPIVFESMMQGMELRVRAPILSRGQYEVESIEVATCFPFAMFWWIRNIHFESKQEQARITVIPVLKQLAGNFHSRLSSKASNSGRSGSHQLLRPKSSNLKGLREFTERDSLNQIHWASSARTGKFLVREFEAESLPDFDVHIDLVQPWSAEQFDFACISAYAIAHYGYRLGFVPQLRLKPDLTWEPLADLLSDIPPGLAGEELIAEILARLSPMPAELRNEFRVAEQEQRKDAISILSEDVSASQRAIISIRPSDEKIIELLELEPGSPDMPSSASSSSLAHIESELELVRL